MKILADASLPGLLEAFPKFFNISFYEKLSEVPKLLPNKDILLCRATLPVNMALLQNNSLRCVATASSGIDHIDSAYLQARKIHLIDAKGCNAIAVADYVISSIAFLQKYKDFNGTRAGVIGIGEVGSQVAKRLIAANFSVCCYDPLKSMKDFSFQSCSLDELRACDLITVHANLHDNPPHPSRNLIDANFLGQLKPGTIIINASRGSIVNEEALLRNSLPLSYCTDVYADEPKLNRQLINMATLCTPHIAGHSIEGKNSAVSIVSRKLHTLFGISAPETLSAQSKKELILPAKECWQDCILEIYNPYAETQLLKKADNLEETFLALRKAHHHRHNFCNYDASSSNEQLRKILG